MADDRKDTRWMRRFDNFSRAYTLLQEAADEWHEGNLTPLHVDGLVRRFRFCTEMAWKTAKDYLLAQQVPFPQITPAAVIREAVAARLVEDGDGWIRALEASSRASVAASTEELGSDAIRQMATHYLECFGQLYETLALKRLEDEGQA